MGLFDFFEDKNDKERKDLEDRMNEMGLDEWEKEEIRNGNYDLDSFDEEDLEDDDYYYEDN